MNRLESSHRRGPLSLRRVGLWLVLLATVLALLSMVFALRQVQALGHVIFRQAQHRALQIATEAETIFRQRLAQALQTQASHCRVSEEQSWTPPPEWPTWIDGLYTWDGVNLKTLSPPATSAVQLADVIRRRMAAKQTGDSDERRPTPEVLYDNIEDQVVVVACGRFLGADGRPCVVVANIQLDRLRSELMEPLLLPGDDLELVHVSEASGPWHQRMFGPQRMWAIQPTRSFINDQKRTVLWQGAISLILTLLVLGTLWGSIWYLVRLARREVALADVKANFVADVSHELKTPLATIQLFGETLQSGRIVSEEKRQEYYAIITRETTRLSNLIENILDFARIEAGKKAYTIRTTDIRRAVQDCYDSYRTQLEHHGFTHELRMAADLPSVSADPDAIAQVLLNLMNNAVKYSGDDKFLLVEVSRDTRRGTQGALISVHDHGIGVEPADQRRLFEGFYRAQDDRVRAKGGAGLGLALVKQIVDAHGGHIHVESRLVKGTTFRVFLPAAEPDESSEDQLQ